MKSKQNNKKAKLATDTNLAPPGTPDNQRSASTPNPSPSGSTSSTGSSHVGTSSSSFGLNTKPASSTDQSTAGSSNGGGGNTTKSANTKSKGAGSSKDTEKGAAAGLLQKASFPSLGAVTHFDLTSFPKINCVLNGNKPGAGGQVASLSGAGTAAASAVAGAAGPVGGTEGNKSTGK